MYSYIKYNNLIYNIKHNIKLFIRNFLFYKINFWCIKKKSIVYGYDKLFKQNISDVKFENTVVKIPLFVMKNYKNSIYSVDTSKFWIDKIQKENIVFLISNI